MNKPFIWFAVFGTAYGIPSTETSYAVDQQQPIIVTATRTAETADESLASVTVITREDIEESGALTVPEVLSGASGVDVTTIGGFGQLTSVFMRGAEPEQVLVLIDGIEVGSVSAGSTAWEFLPLSEIDRIEIVRGPRTSLYGSQAIGGVIQIFTRTGTGPPRARATVGAGSNNTSEVSAGFSGAAGSSWFNVSGSRFRTNGIDAREPGLRFGFFLDEPDDDGYENDAFSARFGHRFANRVEAEIHALHADGNTEFDELAGLGNEDDFRQQVIGAKLRLQPTSRWNVLVEGGRSKDERTTFRDDGSAPESRFDSEIQSFVWQNDLAFGTDHIITLGADLREDKITDSTVNFMEPSRRDEAVFSQYQGKVGRHDLLVGLRTDDNEQFGHETTGNIAWGYDITKPTRVIVSFGTAFRAPSLNDLFFPDLFGSPTSNPNLEPETSKSLEIGLRGKHPYGDWYVRAYRTEVDDLITLDQNFIPQNFSEAVIEGLEAEISANIAEWIARAALSYVDPRDDQTDNRLPRRARRSAKLEAERRFGKTRAALSLIAQSRRFDDPDNTIEVNGYGIVNVAVSRELSKNWTLRGRFNNLFDKEYQTVNSFDELDRNVFVTLAYQPHE